MRHVCDLDSAIACEGEMRILSAESQAVQQREMGLSNRFPYQQGAYMFAALYCAALGAAAGAIRLLKGATSRPIPRRLAEIYHSVPEMALHKTIELEAFLHHRYNGRGLDLGCGNGLVGGVLMESAGLAELHGVDSNGNCRDSALANGYVGFAQDDIQGLSHPDESFDYAISICVIEHVPDLGRALAEVARVLRPGGRFTFSTVAPAFRESTLGYRAFRRCGMRERAERFKRDKDIRSMHFHYLSPREWRTVLGAAGLCDVDVRPIFSARQLLVYDLMNIQVNWMRFYFADKLSRVLARRPVLRRLMVGVTEILSAHFGKGGDEVPAETATHYLIGCTKKAGSATA